MFTAPRAEGELNETADKCVSLSGSGDEVPSRQGSAHTRRSQEGSRDPGTLASLRCQVHRCHLRNSEAEPGSHGQGFEDLPHHTSPPRQSYILIQEFAGGISTNFINFCFHFQIQVHLQDAKSANAKGRQAAQPLPLPGSSATVSDGAADRLERCHLSTCACRREWDDVQCGASIQHD